MEIPKELPANAGDTQTERSKAVTAAGIALVSITVILRYLGRWCLKQRMDAGKGRLERVFGMDDGRRLPVPGQGSTDSNTAFNAAAVLTFFGLCIAVFRAIDEGMGVHIEVVLYERGIKGLSDYSKVGSIPLVLSLANANKAVFVCAVFYNTTLGMIKLSVLSLYRRILRGVQSQTLGKIVWVLFAIVAANTAANVLVVIFQCWPIKAAWDLTIMPEDKR